MQKWEYRTAYLAHCGQGSGYVPGTNLDKELWEQDLERALNKLGEDGWELVSFPSNILIDHVEGYALFKRPKENCL